MNIESLKIDEEFKNLLPQLNWEEYRRLETDIERHGVYSPIITWKGFIVDGHNRYEICKNLEISDVPTKERHFASKSDAMEWIVKNQFARRNLKLSQQVEALEKVREQKQKEAKERQLAAQNNNAGKAVGSNLEQQGSETGRTDEIMAGMVHMSKNTYKDARTIVNHGTPEQIKRMDKGGKGNGVSAIAREVKDRMEGVPEGYRKCKYCGKMKPVKEFVHGKLSCKECRRTRDAESHRRLYKERNGYGEIEKITQMMKDPNRDVSRTEEDTTSEIEWLCQNFLSSFDSIMSHDIYNKNDLGQVLDKFSTGLKERIEKL